MKRIATIVSLFLLVGTVPARAADTAKIDEAVKKGAEFLKGFHAGGVNGGSHGAGSVALSGMALLASGATAKDSTIVAIANSLRPQVFTDNKTYDNALMVLFFDKLGLAEDEGLIQLLGIKLLAGQNSQGGWGYETWSSTTALDAPRWVAAFRAWKYDGRLHPEIAKLYQATRGGVNTNSNPGGMADDNSNTQFALIATWVAGRHAVPIRDAATRLDNRFLRTQDPSSGGWGYSGNASGTTPSMTCAGLLGLAVSFATKSTVQLEANPNQKPDKEGDDDPFNKPPTPGVDKKPGDEEKAAPPVDTLAARRKAAIDRGLAALGRTLAQNQPQQGRGGMVPLAGFGGSNDLYFFWSVERVGVAFGIEQIGKVDWYEWGAPTLLASQSPDGSWGGSYGNEVGTSFAILFLTRTNFAVDLSARLKGKGFGGELRGGGVPQMKAIPFAEQKAPIAEPGKPAPNISGIREVTQADGLADVLVNLPEADFAKKLKEYQAAKGEQYTAAIAFALNRLEKDKKKQARNALVERLVRMTPDTLKVMCKINDTEMRRAAVLACASKDDKSHIPDLVARINDPDDEVVSATRAGLRSLTGEDFGPLPGATEEDKSAVAIKWRHWLSAKGSKAPGN